jgi:sigma-B regulation protein RsbQ
MIKSILSAATIVLLTIISVSSCFFSDRTDEFAKYDSEKYERVTINYQVEGNSDTTLIFIHDWNLNLTYWQDQVSRLRSKYRILNLDLAGHGSSGKGRSQWTSESFARDITNIMEKEQISNAVLIGHSLGADVALKVQEFKPASVAGIIAVENFRDVEFQMTETFIDQFRDELTKFKQNYEEMADEIARKNIRSKNREVITRIVSDYKKADPKIALAVYKSTFPSLEQEKEQLKRLPFKIHIIASDYAPINEAALKKYARAGYDIQWVREAGHFPMVEQPVLFQKALETCLRNIASPVVQ